MAGIFGDSPDEGPVVYLTANGARWRIGSEQGVLRGEGALARDVIRAENFLKRGLRLAEQRFNAPGGDPQKAVRGLVGQTIDQVDVYRFEAQGPAQVEQPLREFERLDAMDRFLDERVEILNPHGNPIEAESPEHDRLVFGRNSRIDLDADFRVRGEIEPFRGVREEILELRGAQVSGGPPAPVKLNDGPRTVDALRHLYYLPFELLEIRMRDLVALIDDDITAAEEAQTLAEGEVHIERERALLARGI